MIITDKFTIRAVNSGDLEAIYTMKSQATRGDFQEFNFESKDSLADKLKSGKMFSEHYQVFMVECGENKHIGTISASFVREGLVRLGIVLLPDSRNKGLGGMITREIVKYYFDNHPIIRIEADTDVKNIAAQKVLESAGFEKEGVLRKYRFHHGNWNDSALYSIIKQH
jgi:diamine N-acetyltransferase